MPSLGDLTINLRANTGQAKRELAAVSAGVAKMQGQVSRVSIAFKRGDITLDQYSQGLQQIRRESAQVGIASEVVEHQIYGVQQALGLATSGVAGFDRAMKQAAASTTAVAVATAPARQGLGTIRSAGASLTARLVGLNGTLGTLVSGIGQFALGNLAAIGVIGGLAAIAAGFRLIGKGAREARVRAGEAIDKLRAMQRGEVVGGDIAVLLAAARTQRRALQAQVAALPPPGTRQVRTAEGAVLTLPGTESQADKDKRRELALALEDEKNLEKRLTQAVEAAANERLQALRDLAVTNAETDRKEREWQRHLDNARARSLVDRAQAVMASRTGVIPTVGQRVAGEVPGLRVPDFTNQMVLTLGRIRAKMNKFFADALAKGAEQGEFAGALSRTVSRALIEGLLTSRRSFGDLLRSIFAAALADALSKRIGNFIGNLFSTAASVGAVVATGGAAGPAVAGGAAGVAGNAIQKESSAIMIPPPRSPTDMARDRDWLNALGTSLDNLKAYGRP